MGPPGVGDLPLKGVGDLPGFALVGQDVGHLGEVVVKNLLFKPFSRWSDSFESRHSDCMNAREMA